MSSSASVTPRTRELGLIVSRWTPSGAATEPVGAILSWHVDDIAATFEKLLSMSARDYQPITPEGFVTAAVVDPFGNVLGIMYKPPYLEVLTSSGEA